MITCTRRIEFDAGHRVCGHESKCAHFHGHRYVVELTAVLGGGKQLDKIGRVVDFSVLKNRIGEWIDVHWDHGMILFERDPLRHKLEGVEVRKGTPQKIFLLEGNPTAENLAYYLLKTVCPRELHGTGVTVTKVRLYETPNCYAEAT